jgi:hypothetical protein
MARPVAAKPSVVMLRMPRGSASDVVAAFRRQRLVQGVAVAGPRAALVLVAREEGIERRGIAVQRGEKDVGAVVEDGLGAVAVVHVHVEDGDPGMARAHVLGRHRHVVDEAESPGHVGEGVVAGRAAQVPAPIGQAVSAIW